MSRWIDFDFVKSKKRFDKGKMKFIVWMQDIYHAPSLDLVRCAECRFKSLYDDGETKYYYCALEDRPNRQWSVDDWNFCYWGERKENNA